MEYRLLCTAKSVEARSEAGNSDKAFRMGICSSRLPETIPISLCKEEYALAYAKILSRGDRIILSSEMPDSWET